jgi:hypothetical protein
LLGEFNRNVKNRDNGIHDEGPKASEIWEGLKLVDEDKARREAGYIPSGTHPPPVVISPQLGWL